MKLTSKGRYAVMALVDLARFKPTCPAFVCAAFLATLFASFVFATLPNNFLATFCATAKPVPYCVRRDVNFARPPASGPYVI